MQKTIYALACLMVFAAGAYVWRVKHTGLVKTGDDQAARAPSDFQRSPIVVEVGTEQVSQDDIDWEYKIVTADVDEKDTLTPIPDLGARYDAEMATLRRQLISSVIERKVLYQYVQRDRDFTYDDPSRYTACMSEWQSSLRDHVPAVLMKGGKDRLKARLCERSILDQYLKERLFAKLKVSEAEIVEYYKNHMNEFKRPELAEVRHILLGDEDQAKKVRNQVTAANFAAMAKTHSIAPEASSGGHLGPFAKGSMPAVFDVAFEMKKGEVSDVLKSNYGYHLIFLLDRDPKKDLSLEEARPKVVASLRKLKEAEEYRKWVDLALASISVSAPKTAW